MNTRQLLGNQATGWTQGVKAWELVQQAATRPTAAPRSTRPTGRSSAPSPETPGSALERIAREIDLAPTTVGDRMERMELAHVVRGYHADADPAAMGYPLQCLMALQTTQATPLEETIDRLMQLPAVAEVFVVTGQWDLLVRLQLADQPELESVLLDDVWSMPSFRHSETMMVLRERRRLPRWASP